MDQTQKFYRITRIVVISLFALLMGWDLIAQIFGGTHATVSQFLWNLASDVPFIPFLTGFFCGHLFWGDPSKVKGPSFLKPEDKQ